MALDKNSTSLVLYHNSFSPVDERVYLEIKSLKKVTVVFGKNNVDQSFFSFLGVPGVCFVYLSTFAQNTETICLTFYTHCVSVSHSKRRVY